MYLHYTGYIIHGNTISNKYFVYLLSTECSFHYEMLYEYYTTVILPFNDPLPLFNLFLMIHAIYYIRIKSSNTISYTFLKTSKGAVYSNQILQYLRLLNS